MASNTTPNDRFQTLLAEFCASVQMPMNEQALGIEFQADGHTVLIAPDPRDAQRMLIEVSIVHLQEPSPQLLMALHHLNHEARLEHDWVVSLDVGDQLCLHAQRDIHTCRASDLQTILAEGIDRAQALQRLCELMAAPTIAQADAPSAQPSLHAAMMMIRG